MSFCIGEDQAQQKKSKNTIFQRRQGESKMQTANKEEHTGEKFDCKITYRDTSFAVMATAAQNQPAKDRNVLIKANRLMALGASGAGADHRQSQRQTVNTHVQKAAECQPYDENRRCQYR